MTNTKKLSSIFVMLGLVFLLQMQGFSQASNQATESSGKKQITRAHFIALNEQQQRDLMLQFAEVNVTDIVNCTKEEAANPQENVIYITLDQFRNSDNFKQVHIVKNPGTYRVYDPQSITKGVENGVIKTKTITMEEYNSMPADKQKAVKESKEFTIIE